MHSRTKRHLAADEITALLRHGLGPRVELREYTPFTDGTFSSVFALTLADGRRLVLKVAPDPELTLMRYETDLVHTEIEFYRRAASVGFPLPRLHAADADLGYLLLERLPGQSLDTARETLAPERLERVRHELGAACARLGAVTGPLFGYPRRDGRTRSRSWRTSFLAMVDDVLADAEDFAQELPAPATTVARILRRHAALLDEVTTPTLVHFDIWDGNVFVAPADPAGDGHQVTGVIDGERAFYGDPIAELVSLALLTEPEHQPGLLPGFLGRPLTENERTRLRMYRVYLYLIMATEGAPRGFDPAEHAETRRHVLQHLDRELTML